MKEMSGPKLFLVIFSGLMLIAVIALAYTADQIWNAVYNSATLELRVNQVAGN